MVRSAGRLTSRVEKLVFQAMGALPYVYRNLFLPWIPLQTLKTPVALTSRSDLATQTPGSMSRGIAVVDILIIVTYAALNVEEV